MAFEKTSKTVDRIAGVIIGTVIFQKIFRFGVFKMVAASSRLLSMFWKTAPIIM